jgi:hypothetical protein
MDLGRTQFKKKIRLKWKEQQWADSHTTAFACKCASPVAISEINCIAVKSEIAASLSKYLMNERTNDHC